MLDRSVWSSVALIRAYLKPEVLGQFFSPHSFPFCSCRETRHKLKSLEIEIEVYKKSISKEEERNELLASILNRSENDGNTSKKLIAQSIAKQDAMKVEFGTYTRTLQETEQALGRTNTVRCWGEGSGITLCCFCESTPILLHSQLLLITHCLPFPGSSCSLD